MRERRTPLWPWPAAAGIRNLNRRKQRELNCRAQFNPPLTQRRVIRIHPADAKTAPLMCGEVIAALVDDSPVHEFKALYGHHAGVAALHLHGIR